LAVLARAVELGKANLSEDDPDVLLTAYELGQAHRRADDPSTARRVLEEAYAAGHWRLGDSDPLMLQISYDIGLVAEELGNRHEARKAFGRVAELGPAALGADHPFVAWAGAYLGLGSDPDFVRPEANDEPTATFPTVAPGGEAGAPAVGPTPGRAAPPPATESIWTPPTAPGDDTSAGRPEDGRPEDGRPERERPAGYDSIAEPTVVQPIITPRVAGPGSSSENAQMRFLPQQRAEPPTEPYLRQPWAEPPAPRPGESSTSPSAHRGAGPPIPAQRTGPPASLPGVYPGRPDGSGPVPRSSAHGGPGPVSSTPAYGDPGPVSSTPAYGDPGPASGAPAYGGLGSASGAPDPYAGGFASSYGSPAVGGNSPSTPYDLRGPNDPAGGSGAYQKRGLGLFAVIAAVLAAIIAVAALVFVLANRSGGGSGDQNVPSLGGGPSPSDVRLRDSGTKIEVTWQDPSGGTVSFLVAMGHPGEQLKPVATLGPGQTSYEMGALNPNLNYCFAVLAVYRNNQFATSAESCTSRASGVPSPSTSK
jgi:hypothetical protein